MKDKIKRHGGSPNRIIYNENTSRQYQDQLRYKALGLCIKCQDKVWEYSSNFCEKHHKWHREYNRKRNKNKTRYKKAKSYKGEQNG